MKITTVISAWQTQEYIMEALESVRQSDEILLGVDGCWMTWDVVKGLKWPNLKLFYFQKCTTYKIRNTLAAMAANDTILFFDSDDIIIDFEMLRGFDSEIVRFRFSNFKTDGTAIKQVLHFSPGCFMVKKSLFMYYNGFQGWPCSADTEFMFRIDKHHKVLKVRQPVFMRRLHAKALTQGGEYRLRSKLRGQINRSLHRRIERPVLDRLVTANYVRA